MKRFVAGLMLGTAALFGAATAHADTNDETFLAVIDHYDVPISHQEALVEGPAVCAFLALPGTTWMQAATQEFGMHKDWSVADAGHFTGAAQAVYCANNGKGPDS